MNYIQELRNEAILLTMEEGYSVKAALWTAYKSEHHRHEHWIVLNGVTNAHLIRGASDSGTVRTEDSETRSACAGEVAITQGEPSTGSSCSEESWSKEQRQRKRKIRREESTRWPTVEFFSLQVFGSSTS